MGFTNLIVFAAIFGGLLWLLQVKGSPWEPVVGLEKASF
jgi:hypothetical protein